MLGLVELVLTLTVFQAIVPINFIDVSHSH